MNPKSETVVRKEGGTKSKNFKINFGKERPTNEKKNEGIMSF